MRAGYLNKVTVGALLILLALGFATWLAYSTIIPPIAKMPMPPPASPVVEQVNKGTKRVVLFATGTEECESCGGDGRKIAPCGTGLMTVKCHACDGTGRLQVRR